MLSSCSDLRGISSDLQCGGYISLKGKCFFNHDVHINDAEVRCSDVVDVVRCGDILDITVCAYAKKDTFPNLLIDSSFSSSSSIYCIWEGDKNVCVAKNSIKSDLECIELGTDICDRFEGCAIVGGIDSLFILNPSFFDLGVCVDHPCPNDFSLGDMKTCPFGCVINGGSPSPLSDNNKRLQLIPKQIENNTSYSNPPNNSLPISNIISLDNNLLINEFQPICVLEVCARHSVTDCLNHTEDICFPSEDGCRFA
jgi:hypothetical protein